VLGILLLFSGVSSVSTRDTEGPEMFVAEEVDGVGDKGSGENHNIPSKDTSGLETVFLNH
jgi:hypothetical protein